MDAIAYSRQHLSPWSDQYQADLQRALAALAFRAGAPSAILHCVWHASQGRASALHFSSSEGPQIKRPLTPVQSSFEALLLHAIVLRELFRAMLHG